MRSVIDPATPHNPPALTDGSPVAETKDGTPILLHPPLVVDPFRVMRETVDAQLRAIHFTGPQWDPITADWAVWIDGLQDGYAPTAADAQARAGGRA